MRLREGCNNKETSIKSYILEFYICMLTVLNVTGHGFGVFIHRGLARRVSSLFADERCWQLAAS